MIIVTTRIDELSEWMDANCASTTYAVVGNKLYIDLADDDWLIWQLKWHGCFILNPAQIWHDNTEMNRLIITLMQAQTYNASAIRAVQSLIDRFRKYGSTS
jgi:hypothetical protein